MKSKFLILVAALMLAALSLLACNTSGSTTETSDTTTAAQDTTTVTNIVGDGEAVTIIKDSETVFKVIRPDLTSTAVQDASIKLRSVINEHYKLSIAIETDFEGRNFNVENRHKYEILVGATNRDESVAAIDSLKYNDFIITMTETRVVITGGCDEATVAAVDYFIENYIKDDALVMTVGTVSRVNGKYIRNDVKLGGVDLSDYSIIYTSDLKSSAQLAAQKLGINTGAIMSVGPEKTAADHIIYLNSTKFSLDLMDGLGVDDFKIVAKDGNIHIVGGSDWAAETALERFIDYVSTGAASSEISLESCALSYTLPDRSEYINDITKLALHWELNFDVPEWMLDFDEKYRALNDGNGRLMSCMHRGDMVYYPENSLEGVISSIMMGGDMIEIDPRKTKDGVLILMHDDTLDRTTNVTELAGKNGLPASTKVSDWTYEQLLQLNLKEANGGVNAKVTPYKIPTLDEIFKVCANRIFIRLDVKADENGTIFWNYEKDIWTLQQKYETYYNVIFTWHNAFTSNSYKLVKNYTKTQKELTGGKSAPFFVGYKALSDRKSVV